MAAVNFTTLLDLVGLLLIVLALALAAGLLFVPAGIAVAGCGVLAVSWLCDRRAVKR